MPDLVKQYFERIFASGREGVILLSLDRIIARANPATTLMLGYSASELEGRDVDSLLHPDERARTMAAINHVIAAKVENAIQKTRFLGKFGTHVNSWFNLYPVHHQGAVHSLIGFIWPEAGQQTEEILTAIQRRIEQLELVIETEHHAGGKDSITVSMYGGDVTGGDKTGRDKIGRDKTVNSQAPFYWICGVLIAIVAMLSFAAFYFSWSQHRGQAPPPQIPGVQSDAP